MLSNERKKSSERNELRKSSLYEVKVRLRSNHVDELSFTCWGDTGVLLHKRESALGGALFATKFERLRYRTIVRQFFDCFSNSSKFRRNVGTSSLRNGTTCSTDFPLFLDIILFRSFFFVCSNDILT